MYESYIKKKKKKTWYIKVLNNSTNKNIQFSVKTVWHCRDLEMWSMSLKVVWTGSLSEQNHPPLTFTYPFTVIVVGAPQMTSRPVSSIFLCSPLPSGTWQIPGLAILWLCLPTSLSVCLVFFLLSLYLARWFWPDLMNGRHDHTTAVCISLQWSGGLHVVQLPAGSWHRLPCW